jgi:hypothetical protein
VFVTNVKSITVTEECGGLFQKEKIHFLRSREENRKGQCWYQHCGR